MEDLCFALFAQTLAFVAFNKVVTAQYFIWYLALLPLVLPFTRLRFRWRGFLLLLAFFAAEIAWGLAAYQIEFAGRATFHAVWFAGIVFFAVQVGILVAFILHHDSPGAAAAVLGRAKEKAR